MIRDSFIEKKQARHRNVSTALLSQNLFTKAKHGRGISLNASHICIFRCIRDRSQLAFFCRQVLPQNAKNLASLFAENCSEPYSYIFFDFNQTTPNYLRFLTNIFDEHPSIFTCDADIPPQSLQRPNQIVSNVQQA